MCDEVNEHEQDQRRAELGLSNPPLSDCWGDVWEASTPPNRSRHVTASWYQSGTLDASDHGDCCGKPHGTNDIRESELDESLCVNSAQPPPGHRSRRRRDGHASRAALCHCRRRSHSGSTARRATRATDARAAFHLRRFSRSWLCCLSSTKPGGARRGDLVARVSICA